jgi:hypothetical protein
MLTDDDVRSLIPMPWEMAAQRRNDDAYQDSYQSNRGNLFDCHGRDTGLG